MNELGLYSLSAVLSFLSERDGLSFLLTNKRLSRLFLPLFRLPWDSPSGENQRAARYRFVVAPVQDPAVLLARINTRRLFQRKQRPAKRNLDTAELAEYEWSQPQEIRNCANNATASVPAEPELLRFGKRDNPFHEHGPILLVSYPRSGNTLVRTLLERATGFVTGSDTRPDRSLSRQLAEQHNLVGEGVTASNRCAFIKTHWPERAGCRPFTAQRAILLVRNPYDAIDSYWNMNATKSHTKTLTNEMYERFQDKWDGLVRNEIHIWFKFLDAWLGEYATQAPVLIVRFEDLIQDPALQLSRMLAFSLNQKASSESVSDLSSYWKERIRRTTTTDSTANLGSYQPRAASKGTCSIGKSLQQGHYTEELLYFMHNAAAQYPVNYLMQFGYDIFTQTFPNNFWNHRAPPLSPDTEIRNGNQSNNCHEPIAVNSGMLIRSVDCPYGRLLQKWRHLHTNNDADPLPTTT